MKRFWITAAALWLVFMATVFGLWRVLLLVQMPSAAFNVLLWTLYAVIAVATLTVVAKQFLQPRSPVLFLAAGASLVASSGAVFLTFLVGGALLGEQLIYVMGLVGIIELALVLLVCAIETVWITAAIARIADGRRRSALTSAST